MTVRLYTQTTGTFPGGTRTQIATTTVNVANQTATVLNVPLAVTVPAGTTELIMEVFTPNGQAPANNSFFIGSNAAAQTGPSYISAAACALPTPVTTASIGFPNMHIVMNINGSCAPISISGTVIYCSNPTLGPVPGVTMTLTGTSSGSTVTDGSGNYTFTGLPSGGTYTVTPSKAARTPGSAGINGVDVLAVQRHFLNIALIPVGCRRTAADVNGVFPPGGDGTINGVDVLAIQKFFLGITSGIGNVGKYKFTPASVTYTAITTSQTAPITDTLIFGDVTSAFVHRPGGTAGDDGMSADEVPATVAAVALPEVAVDQSNFVAAVRTSAIDAKSNLVGFQGDFTFDERVLTFQSQPVQKAGLTGGNWEVSGNVLPGPGPMRTLRVLAFSNDGVTPLSGEGTLFNLNMTRVSSTPGASTQLIWAASPDQFIFIDGDLKTQKAGNAAPGSVTLRPPSQR